MKEEKTKFFVCAKNETTQEIVILDEMPTEETAQKILEWYEAHKWLFAENVVLFIS